MGSSSKIEWTDATWNIAVGCRKVDADCKFCYMYILINQFMFEELFNPSKNDTLSVGDVVKNKVGAFTGTRKILKIRKVHNYSEGDAVTVEGSDLEYWSKYLKKV